MVMKKIICLFCVIALSVSGLAQTKVLESSSKKAPEWLNTAVEDYLVVTVTSNTLADAQSKALSEISERIIMAVASNVAVTSKNELSEVNTNGQVDSKDVFNRISKMKSANLPFLKGVSLSNVEDVYWQKLRNKSTYVEYYEYSVKYPFTKAEQNKLIAEFEKLDAEKVAEFEGLEQRINEIESVEEIGDCIAQLDALIEYFFDEVRQSQAEALKKRYKMLYDALTVAGTFIEQGKYKCQLLLDGNPIHVSAAPKVLSNCAGQLSALPSDGGFIISYNAIDCLPDEENYLNITFRINGKKLEHKVFLAEESAAGSASFSVVPEGKLILMADETDADSKTITGINIRLTLNNRGGLPFGLKSLEIQIPEITAPIVFDDIDGIYTTKGIVQIKAKADGVFTVKEKKGTSVPLVQGAITFVNPQTSEVERKRISLPYVTNWE